MDDNHIFYEANDGKMRVNDADLPSEEVKRYYIKESVYFNQHTGTFSTQVEALCPLMVSGDFGDGSSQTTPLFWVKYDEAAPYLAKLSLMSSNLNTPPRSRPTISSTPTATKAPSTKPRTSKTEPSHKSPPPTPPAPKCASRSKPKFAPSSAMSGWATA